MTRNRRALVLCDEAARHPFRQTLPPHVRKLTVERVPFWHRISATDVRDFMLAYCAAFVAVSTFIA